MAKIRQAFSLFEILIVIVLLSLLIVTSYLVIPKLIQKAFDARRKSDVDNIKKSLEIYYSFAEEFPDTLPDCGQPLVYKTQVIMPSIPCDPVTKESYYFQTKKINNKIAYRLYAILANSDDTSIAKVGCQGGCGSDCLYNYGVSSMNIGLVQCSYVCAPGGGRTGFCEFYGDPSISLCPKLYGKDSTCGGNGCSFPTNRCDNASGKYIPY